MNPRNNLNFGSMMDSPLAQQAKTGVIANLPAAPQSNQEDGIGGLFQGLKSLIGSKTTQSAQPVNNQQPTMQSNPSSGLASMVGNQPNQFTPAAQVAGSGAGLNDLYNRPAFKTALQAQQEAFKSGVTKSPIMTVVDYSIPSDQPRLWVVDTKDNKVLMNTYVAHGSGSGKGTIPTSFSNQEGSHSSSLGTYLTGNTYQGKHGESLRVQGLEKGVNDQAFQRAVVVHGANYVGKDKSGTSWGCFAVPGTDAPKLIGLTKGGSIVHAYAPDKQSINNFSQSLSSKGATELHQAIGGFGLKNANPDLTHTMEGISGVESGGDYGVISKASRNGDRAYGKYQVMGRNVPAWTQEALGTPMTSKQFVSDPQAQEKVAAFKINQYLQQGYSPQDAASMWFTGRPLNKAGMNVKDAYGTTNAQYQKKFNKGYLKSKVGTQALNTIQQPIQKEVNPTDINYPTVDPEIYQQVIRGLDKGHDDYS